MAPRNSVYLPIFLFTTFGPIYYGPPLIDREGEDIKRDDGKITKTYETRCTAVVTTFKEPSCCINSAFGKKRKGGGQRFDLPWSRRSDS